MAENSPGFIASAVSVVAGVALIVLSGGSLAVPGASLIIAGVFAAGSIAFMPDANEAVDDRQSPTYGFAQFRNPKKGDTPLNVIYAADGIKVAPVWLQAFITPRGMADDDERRASRFQSLSGLLGFGEGPITEVTEIRFNDEPVLERIDRPLVPAPNGTRTKWTLSNNRVLPKTVSVTLDGVEKGYFLANKSEMIGTGDGVTTTYSFRIPDDIADEVPVEFYNRDPANELPGDPDQWKFAGFQTWLITKNRLIIHRDEPLAFGQTLYMQYGVHTTDGLTITQKDDKLVLKFDVAPATDSKLRVNMLRKNIRGMDLYIRHGGAHQLPVWGFHSVRNSQGVQEDLPQGVIKDATTNSDEGVDDVVVLLASGVSGAQKIDPKDGDTSGVKMQFKLEVKRVTATAAGTDTFDIFYRLPDPRGADANANKASDEFQVLGHSANQLFWGFSIRNLLDKYADKKQGTNKGAAARKAADDFTRDTYEVQVTRTNPVAADTNQNWADELVFVAITEVQDEMLNLPGTSLLGFHALGTEKLNGSAPNVTALVKGKRNVEKLVPVSDEFLWTPGVDNQSNRVWASIDLITNFRYGWGAHYTKAASIDYASAIQAAAFQEDQVATGPNTTDTEQRSRLNCVLDTRKSLMQHLRNLLLPGRVWAVLRGDVWFFIVDDPVPLVDGAGNDLVPILFDDGFDGAGRTARDSLTFSHDTIASRVTEVQLTYLDRESQFQRKPIWILPQEPETRERRIHRADAFGITTETEANRYGLWIYYNLRDQGTTIGVAASPQAMNWAAGTVIRVISNRVGIAGYWRIHGLDLSSDNFYSSIIGKQYNPEVYGQQVDKQAIILNTFDALLAPPPPQIRAPAASAPEAAAGTATPTTKPKKFQNKRRKKRTVRMRRVA